MDSIIKSRPRNNFTVVSNDCLKDSRLSWKAKGIICYIMSLPDDWKLSVKDLQNRATDGRDSLYSGIKELEKYGYCKKVMMRKADGTIEGYSYEISDTVAFEPFTEKPETDKPETDKPFTENPHLLNTNNEQNTNDTNNTAPKQNLGALQKPEQEQQPEQEEKARKTLFSNCKYADMNVFLEYFEKQPGLENVDLVYYYHAVSDWSDSKNMKRTARGWLATVRQFMRSDSEKGKLKLKPAASSQQKAAKNAGAVEYLKGFE